MCFYVVAGALCVTIKLNNVGSGQETKVVNCNISDPTRSSTVSGLGMCITKVGVLQNK